MRIAALMTCHNRRSTTVECLTQLISCKLPPKIQIEVYLVDDGCTDGTGDAVEALDKNIRIIRGSGDLYWAHGTHLAAKHASKDSNFDGYLWLNDDMLLDDDCFIKLGNALSDAYSRQRHNRIIMVGSAKDAETGETTYGGYLMGRGFGHRGLKRVLPKDSLVPCDTMNGNFVYISREAFSISGNIDPVYRHGMADIDYGLRAKRLGVEIYLLPGHVGTCSRNIEDNPTDALSTSFIARVREVSSQKRLPPKQWFFLTFRHYGIFWPAYFAWPYLKAAIGQKR